MTASSDLPQSAWVGTLTRTSRLALHTACHACPRWACQRGQTGLFVHFSTPKSLRLPRRRRL